MIKNVGGWNDISIKKYIQLYNLEENKLDEIDTLINQLSIVYDLSIDDVESLDLVKVNELRSEITFLNSEPKQTKNLDNPIIIDGKMFIFNKNLNSLSFGEFVDLETYKSDVINNIHKIASILFRSEDFTKYNTQEADSNAELFLQEMDIETALSGFFFVYLFALNYIMSDTKGYSMLDKAMIGMTKNLKEMMNQKDEVSVIHKTKTKKNKTKNSLG